MTALPRILALLTVVAYSCGVAAVSAAALFTRSLPLLAYAAGLGLVAAGAWKLSPSAGLVVGGAGLAGSSLAYVRGGPA